MKTILIVLMALSFSFSGNITVGGYVPLVSNISCIQETNQSNNPNIEVLLATCVISNNAQVFSAKFQFGFGEEVTELRMQGGEGTLGNGIDVPNESIPIMSEYTWNVNQKSATLEYVVRFYGKLNGRVNTFIQYATMNSIL